MRKDNISEEGKKKKSRKGKALRVLLLILLIIILLFLIIFLWLYTKYGKQLTTLRRQAIALAADSSEETFRASRSTLVYYSDGQLMSTLKNEKEVYYLYYDDIPQYVVSAMLSVEDRKFYQHSGYDIYAIVRAAKAYITNKGEIKQGGSTITQQLARTVFLTNEKTIERKVTEIFMAAELEKKYSKNKIIEFYINNIYFANGFYGIQAASLGYFGKTSGELSLSQTAYLCAIPNNPTTYNPIKQPEAALERRDSVLLQMYETGSITFEEYDSAVNEKIEISLSQDTIQNYEETYTYFCAIRELMAIEGFNFRNNFVSEMDKITYEDNYNEEYYRIKRSLFTKGYRIYTSINRQKQEQLQEAVDLELAEFREKNEEGVFEMQAAATCIDNDTGRVVAIIGGRGQMPDGYTLNRAYQSPRQPGSSIKPLIVYTPAFESGYYPDSIVTDERFEGGPRNSGNIYSGDIELRYAIAVSKNTVAWRLFEEITPEKGLSYLLNMGFNSIVSTDYVPAAALGGLTYGVTSVEMTSAYAALENMGVFRTPTCIIRIMDADGKTIADNTVISALTAEYITGEQVYEKNAALIMTDVLRTVMETGTGKKLKLSNITSAGKTGTTNDQKDGWFLGYTKYYTTGVWVGYDMPREVETLMGNTYPGLIWKHFMEYIHDGLKDMNFENYIDRRPKELPQGETSGTETNTDGAIAAESDMEGETNGAETNTDGAIAAESDMEGETSGTETNTDGEGSAELGNDRADGVTWIAPDSVNDTIWNEPNSKKDN